MADKKLSSKLLQIVNKNLPVDDKYTSNEITTAFSKADYSLGTKKEQLLFRRIFKECANNECLKELKETYKISTQKIKELYRLLSNEEKIEFGTFWSSRFRLPKIIGNILPRDHAKYIEIDCFKQHELTPCIAYEMAIRNEKVQMLLKKYKLITNMCNDNKYLRKKFFTKNNFQNAKNHPILVLSKEYEKCTYEEYEALIIKKLNTYKQLIEKDYKKFIDEYIDKCTELTISELMLIKEKIEDELINDYLIYPKGYKRKVPGVKYWYQEEITNSKKEKGKKAIDKDTEDKGWQIGFEEIIDDTFIQVQGVYIKNSEYFVNNIIPNFNRQVNNQNQINIPINFSLPLEEIIEYITKVKKKINPKTPLELLGIKLEQVNNVTIESEKISLNATRGENTQKKFADLLYIYDMKKRFFK